MKPVETSEELAQPVTISADAYISPDYARAERDLLWRRIWLQAGRIEDLDQPGDYITYDIGPDSIIIMMADDGGLRAFHNVCVHRGRRLIDTPTGERNARGNKSHMICGFHGWTYDREGQCTFVQHQQDWQGALTPERTALGKVQVDQWGGWIWINLDPNAGPLMDWLKPVPDMLDPFQLQNMRCRWRKWIIFDCNWKVALEAFNETYHVQSTHPEFNEFGQFRGWARNHGWHSNIGYDAPKGQEQDQAKLRLGAGDDPRLSTADMQNFTWENANTNTTETLVKAAQRLKDELPAGTAAADVSKHWLDSARADDAKRGVFWPVVAPADVAKSGTSWQVFPNFQIGHAVNNMLCYAARPYGDDPEKCIFEAAVYELYPKGEAPETRWEYCAADEWPPVLQQDFANMRAVQQGMKNVGFRGTLPNPYMERAISSLHHNLAKFMGQGAPELLD